MASGKSDGLKKLASELLCSKCQTHPRLANAPRCRGCLRIDTECELAARSQLLAGKGSTKPKRSAARKPQATALSASASKALTVVARPAPPVAVPSVAAEPVRELGRPYSLSEWQSMITQVVRRWPPTATMRK
jgi:hypothetical protein